MRVRPLSTAILTSVVALSACASGTGAPSETSPLPGRLVVSSAEAAVFTISPEGADRIDLVGEEPGVAAVQPTWSPDGNRLVWTEVDHMNERPQVSIVTAGAGGEDLERANTAAAPFYYYWDPSGRVVAFLANGPGGSVDLSILDREVRLLGGARPFYFDWSPDGERLLTHTDLNTLAVIAVDAGGTNILGASEARFQAPQWSQDGEHLVYAIGSPPPTGGIRAGAMQTEGQEIVVATTDGQVVQRVSTFLGVATFELSPDGTRIAHSDTLDRTAFNFGPLIVTDVTSGGSTTVSSEAVLAYQWSPAGDSLLYLASEEGVDHPSFRWAIWDGETSTTYDLVTPTAAFATAYLPFWDQYSRSHRLWSPDGSAFVYSGTDDQGEPSIWVQRVGDDVEPLRVATGDVAFWSPR